MTTLTTPSIYTPPATSTQIDLRLDRNEGPPPGAEDLAPFTALAPEDLNRYPDPVATEAMLATALDEPKERVMLTAGADDALERLIRAFGGPDRPLLTFTPTFEMISRYTQRLRAEMRAINWSVGDFPMVSFLELITPELGCILCTSPNNPTGLAIRTADLVAIARRARDLDIPFIVDQAYIEFSDDDPTDALRRFDNVVLVRTFSKAWGLAGLRLGCAIGEPTLLDRARAFGQPYAIAAPSLRVLEARLSLSSSLPRLAYLQQAREERRLLEEVLGGLGLNALPSQANFVFARGLRARDLAAALRNRGVATRTFDDNPSLSDAIRITCPGDALQIQLLLTRIRAAAIELGLTEGSDA